ncbi:MAG TPA: hypothetical protein VNN25_21270 [Thermoanaerobaculia bacterium]|nr:hypothetical protein [Thermoanaerobaculia bacterium]
MKKTSAKPDPDPDLDDDLRPHYDFDFKTWKPNRFAGMDLKFKGRPPIILDADVAEVFDSPEAVNTVLRSVIKAMRRSDVGVKPKKARSTASPAANKRRAS